MKLPKFRDLICFENEDYLVVNKPPHLASLHERDLSRDSILEMAREQYGDVQLCHRLDKETSGAMAIAKHPEAYRHLSIQFEERRVGKIYHAVCVGIHRFEDVLVNIPISYNNKKNIARLDKLEGKHAETLFKTGEVFYKHTLVKCLPVTGRMHQIRVHLTSLQAPIVADQTYGGRDIYLSEIKRNFNLKKETEEEPLIKRIALHAFSIAFVGLDGVEIMVEAEYPKDMKALIRQLRKHQ